MKIFQMSFIPYYSFAELNPTSIKDKSYLKQRLLIHFCTDR